MWILFFLIFATLTAEECLSDIRQLTFPEMGFERAGEAYFSPDETKIIFQAVPVGKNHYQMYVMDLEERVPRMVSTGKGACTCGFFDPNGHGIIFASSHSSPSKPAEPKAGRYSWDLTPYMNIYRADVDGQNLKPLTSGLPYCAECAYSPDGESIVFASDESGSMNLYTMRSDGSERKRITHTNHCYNGGPFFSPDGTRVIFRADRYKKHYLQIFMVNRDGTGEKQLTFNDGVNWAPYWHPDNRHIAYTRSVDGHRRYDIYLLDTETCVERPITNHSAFDGLPVFNRDGTKLMWTSKREGSCQIFIANFRMDLCAPY